MAVPPSRDLWHLLPIELRVEIQKHIPDLPSFRNLLVAIPSDQPIYHEYASEIKESVIRDSDTEISCSIRNFLGRRGHLAAGSESFTSELQAYVKHNNLPPLGSYSPADTMASIFYIAEVADFVEQFVEAFAQRRILIPSGRPQGQLSSTELHRVRRALWCFCEIYEWQCVLEQPELEIDKTERRRIRFIAPQSRDVGDPGKEWLFQEGFYRSQWPPPLPPGCGALKGWQLIELDAIRNFIRDEINSVQLGLETSTVILQAQPILIQRLIRDLASWPPRASAHILTMYLGAGESFHRPMRGWRKPIERQPNPDFRESLFLHRRQRSVNNCENWGWCMWDRDRLMQCGMVESNIGRPTYDEESSKLANVRNFGEATERLHRQRLPVVWGDWRVKARFDADVARSESKAPLGTTFDERRRSF